MFRFTKEGRLQSLSLMYAFFLGLGVLFVDFILSNRLTIWFEAWFPAMSRAGKNALGILGPRGFRRGAFTCLPFRFFLSENTPLSPHIRAACR